MKMVALSLVTLLVAACGGSAPTGTGLAPAAASPTAAPSVGVPASAASASPVPSTRVDGTVQSVTATTLTLADGTIMQIAATTRTVRTDKATIADLRTGFFVAITAKQQPDGTLLASIVNVFPASLGATIPAGQRPLTEGNLMTNAPIASIDQVTGTGFTVTFSGTTAKVVLAPGAVITRQTDVKPEDLPAGTKVSVTVRAGVALSIQIQGP